MHPSLRCCSVKAHTPLIKFLGKRSFPNQPEAPHPHPAAPAELKHRFSEFLAKMNSPSPKSPTSSSRESSNVNVYNEFWKAPIRFWQPRVRELTEREMDSIMSGGASSY